MTRSLRRSRRSTKKGISEYNEGDIVEVSVIAMHVTSIARRICFVHYLRIGDRKPPYKCRV